MHSPVLLLLGAGMTCAACGEQAGQVVDAAFADAGEEQPCEQAASFGPATAVLDEPGSWYRYAPAVLVDAQGQQHVWVCGNATAGQVKDHILYSHRDVGGALAPWQVALAPSEQGGWDSFHVCDPAVVAGEFGMGGTRYGYAMLYSGNDLDAINHVQLGVAVSADLAQGGDWTRAPQPLLSHPDDGTWGTGQPTAVSLGSGLVQLFYTRADPVPHVYTRRVDLSDLLAPQLGDEVQLSERGLVDLDGNPDVLTNVDVLLLEAEDQLLLLSERHPLPSDPPAGLARAIGLLTQPWGQALGGEGTWQQLGSLDEGVTGSTRNHNAGFVRDPRGRPATAVSGYPMLVADACNGCDYPQALFDVRLAEVQVDLDCR